MVNQVEIVLEQTEVLDTTTAAPRLLYRMEESTSKLNKLVAEAYKSGYRPSQGPQAEMGLRQKLRASNLVQPDLLSDEEGQPVQELEFELLFREFEKPDSQDSAAVVTVTLTAGQSTEEYNMLLVASAGNFAQAREFTMENDQLVRANSWWTAVRDCLINKCGASCVGSLVTCSGTWSAYLLCLAARCGGCWIKCTACATCNCKWWCKWGVGCCRR